MAALRICFISGSIVQGTRGTEGRGWVGRLVATGATRETELTAYNLGIRGDTSDDIRRWWRDEATRRLPRELLGAMVSGFGLNDTLVREDGR